MINKIEQLRKELNRLYLASGLNDIRLKKSQELDELIVISQRNQLENLKRRIG